MKSKNRPKNIPLADTTKFIVDNRGKTAPTALTGIPLIATNCISNERLYPAYENLRYVSDETYRNWFRSHPMPGDIILTNKGSQNGAICLVPDPVDFVIAQDMVALRADESVIDPLYLFAALRSSDVQRQIKTLDVSGVIPHFKKSDFDKLFIPYPERRTQEAIGQIYYDFCRKIELNRCMNATMESMARALFQSWFVDFDPVRTKMDGRKPAGINAETTALFPDSFEQSELGGIPKGWEVCKVQEIIEGLYDGPHATPPDATEGAVFLGIKNLTGTGLNLDEIRYIGEDEWPRWTKRVTPKANDIVFSYEATLGFFALIPSNLRCCLGRRLALLRLPERDGYPHFWFHQFVSSAFKTYLMQHTVQGATVDRVPLLQFPTYQLIKPPHALMDSFETFASKQWSLIHANSSSSRTLATLRDTLLPKLISGELSVKHAEKVVGEAT